MNGDLGRIVVYRDGLVPVAEININQLSGWDAAKYARMTHAPKVEEKLRAHAESVRRRTAVSFDMARDMAFSALPWELVQAAADADSAVTSDYLLHHASSRGAGQLASCERAHPWSVVEDGLLSLTAYPLEQEDPLCSACEEWLIALTPAVQCDERNWRVLLCSLALARGVADLSLHLQALRPEPKRQVDDSRDDDTDAPDLVVASHDGRERPVLWEPSANPYLRAQYVDGVLRVRALHSNTLWSPTPKLAESAGPLKNTHFHNVDSPRVVISIARQMRIHVPSRVVNFYTNGSLPVAEAEAD